MVDIRKDTETPTSNLKVITSTDSITYLSGIRNIFRLDNHTRTLSPLYYTNPNITINSVCSDAQGIVD